jgi:hypothetical protein
MYSKLLRHVGTGSSKTLVAILLVLTASLHSQDAAEVQKHTTEISWGYDASSSFYLVFSVTLRAGGSAEAFGTPEGYYDYPDINWEGEWSVSGSTLYLELRRLVQNEFHPDGQYWEKKSLSYPITVLECLAPDWVGLDEPLIMEEEDLAEQLEIPPNGIRDMQSDYPGFYLEGGWGK